MAEKQSEAKHPENHFEWKDPAGLTPRERLIAEQTLLAPVETRKSINRLSEELGMSYEVVRNARLRAARKLGLNAKEFSVSSGVRHARPTELNELEVAMKERTIDGGMTIQAAAVELGVHYQAAYSARRRVIEKLGLEREKYARRGGQPGRSCYMTWDESDFCLIAYADPEFKNTPMQVCDSLAVEGVPVPLHLRGVLTGFRHLTYIARLRLIKRAHATVEFWARRYKDEGGSCQYCADMEHRRPCPGLCPVCRKPGENEVLERPELIHSNAGLIDTYD